MEQYWLFIIWVLVVIIIFITTPKKCSREDFINMKYKFCPECGQLGQSQCNECANCGYSTSSSGKNECVPGDLAGPYFNTDESDSTWESGANFPYEHVFPTTSLDFIPVYWRSHPFWKKYYQSYPKKIISSEVPEISQKNQEKQGNIEDYINMDNGSNIQHRQRRGTAGKSGRKRDRGYGRSRDGDSTGIKHVSRNIEKGLRTGYEWDKGSRGTGYAQVWTY